MLWYYNNKQSYIYPSREPYSDELTELTRKKHYENSQEDSIVPSLIYMWRHGIENAACVVPIEDLSVNYGRDGDIDFDYCDEHGIPYFFIDRKGGAIVLFPGSIAVDAIYSVPSCNMAMMFLEDMVQFLEMRGINASIEGNDLMVDGKKIVGAVGQPLPTPFDGYSYMGFSISINSDAELIDRICTKPMEKVPGALSDYGITTQEVMDFLLVWFDTHRSMPY